LNDENIRKAEITTRLSGILYWKATSVNSIEKVYMKVIEWLEEIPEEEFDITEALGVLGNVGG